METRRAVGTPLPVVPNDAVARPRLGDRLTEGVGGPFTLVSAPAGYGKSLLVSAWAASRSRDALVLAYQSLREDDEEPPAFWAAALDCLSAVGVDVSDVAVPAATATVDRRLLRSLEQTLAAHDGPVVWVVDAGEFTLPPVVCDGLHRLVTSVPDHLRLVLLTRADPALPLHRYRLDGTVTELRVVDLAFNAAEAARFVEHRGLELDPVDVGTLRVRTGGWPAGMRFATLSLTGRSDTDAAIAEFRGDRGNVAAYLMSEVFAKQPPTIADFLLRTCVVDDLTPALAAVLTGDHCDEGMLQFLEHATSFVEPVPGRPGCYRYPSLLREFLRAQLAYDHPGLEPELHRRAAEWLAEEGDLLAAVQHAAAGGDWVFATRVLADELGCGALLVGSGRHQLQRLLADLPDDVDGPQAAVVRAALAVGRRHPAAAETALDHADLMLAAAGAPPTTPCSVTVLALRALVASAGTDLDRALDLVVAADAVLRRAAEDDVDVPPELAVLVAGSRARVLLERRDLEAAAHALEEGCRAADRPWLGESLVELQGMAALVEAVAGRLRRATQLATRLLTETDGTAGAPHARAASVALAWVRTEERDLAAAQQLVGTVGTGGSSFDARLLGGAVALIRARLASASGDHDLARAELRAALPPGSSVAGAGWPVEALVAEQASSLLVEGRPEEAAALLDAVDGSDPETELVRHRVTRARGTTGDDDQTRPTARVIGQAPLDRQVGWLLLQAAQAHDTGDDRTASERLGRALRLAAPESLRRPFVDAEDDVRALVDGASAAATRWLRPAGASSPVVDDDEGREAASSAGSPVEALTRKETEVLGHLAELLTTEEIAERMFVSVNTVRSHVRSLLRKLGVARRNEAVRRAWDLGLLPRRAAEPSRPPVEIG